MTTDTAAEVARLKTAIANMMRRVPASVNGGGLKTTRAYKEAVEFAKKQVNSSRASLNNLQTAYTRLSAYE